MPTPAPTSADRPDPAALDAARTARRWDQALAAAEKDRETFLKDGRTVVERYRNEAKAGRTRRKGMPILYANTEQLHAALYQKPAKPDVRRRFADRDPVGQQAAEMIERALTYFDDTGDVDATLSAAVQDMLLPGRGTVRIEYEPTVEQRPQVDPVTGQPLFVADDDGTPTDEPATVDFIADQKIHHHYVFWQDFLHAPARRWVDVSWVAFRHVMDRDAIEDEVYGNAGPDSTLNGTAASVPLDWMPEGSDRADKAKADDSVRRAEIWEIWDRPSATRLWVVKSAPWPLRVDPDPYGLEGFFPLPEPLSAYRTNDSVIPQALFKAYEDQADDLDELSRRISILTKALKRRGVYNQAIPELKRLASANDNEYIPSPNFGALQSSGGLTENFLTEDIRPIAATILELMKQRDAQIQAIYEISAISDIMRGSTDPDETLGAQQLKAQTGSMRLRRMQNGVQKFIRDLNRIKVDLMCRHFEPDVLSKIADMQVTPEIMQTLQSDAMRGYVVDIETDSTMFADAAQMQKARGDLIKGITDLTTAWGPILLQKPQLVDFFFDLMAFGVAPAHDARQIQDSMDQAKQVLQQQAMQPPMPNPKEMAEQQQLQAQTQIAQTKAQAEAAKGQTAVQVAQISAQAEQAKAQGEVQRQALQIQQDQQAHQQDMARADAAHQQAMVQAQQKHELALRQAALKAAAPAQQPASPVGPAQPPIPGAVQAPDGHHYVALPHAQGKFHRVTTNG